MKRRPDAWETPLTEEQRLQAFEFLQACSYTKASHLIAKEFSIRPPSIPALCRFFEWYSRKLSDERLHQAVINKVNIESAAGTLGDTNTALAAALSQLALQAACIKDQENVEKFVNALSKVLAAIDTQKRTSLLEQKAVAARKEVEAAISKGGLTPETLQHLEETLKLL